MNGISIIVVYDLIHNKRKLHLNALGLTKLELIEILNQYNLSGDCKNTVALIKSIDSDEKFIDKLSSKDFFTEYNSTSKNYFFGNMKIG